MFHLRKNSRTKNSGKFSRTRTELSSELSLGGQMSSEELGEEKTVWQREEMTRNESQCQALATLALGFVMRMPVLDF